MLWRGWDGDWASAEGGAEAEGATGRSSMVLSKVSEPPNVLFQFPPDEFVFIDPENVHAAVLVTYFAFHRHPQLEGGSLVVSIDWSQAARATVARDGEGVFELGLKIAGPFAERGWTINPTLTTFKPKP